MENIGTQGVQELFLFLSHGCIVALGGLFFNNSYNKVNPRSLFGYDVRRKKGFISP